MDDRLTFYILKAYKSFFQSSLSERFLQKQKNIIDWFDARIETSNVLSNSSNNHIVFLS